MIDCVDADMTVIRFSSGVPGPLERRSDRRHMAVLKVGKLITARHQALCLIRNISAGGTMIHTAAPLAPGEPLAIEFNTGLAVRGEVAWIDDGATGIAFARQIDVLGVLAPPPMGTAREAAFVSRPPRLELDGRALLESAAGTGDVELLDISQGGAKIAAGRMLAADERIILSAEGLPARTGRVCWSTSRATGVAFNLALPFDLLAHWALRQQPRLTLADMP